MAVPVTADGTAAVPHYGPIRQDCPVQCLQAVLSQSAYRPLERVDGAWFPPPRTVGDVIGLYARRCLRDIRGLGRRRISEIEAALVLAGFDLTAYQHPAAPLSAGEAGGPAGDPAAAARTPAPQHSGPAAGCPVCGAPAGFPPSPPQPVSPLVARRARAAERTAQVIDWMAANCHRSDVTVAEVARVAGLSPRRLQAVLSRGFGRGPVRLMADMRLHRVHLALTGREPAPASLAEAAALAGYSRVTRFKDAYRARYGRYPALPGQPAAARGARQAGSPLPSPAEPPEGRSPAQ